MSWNTFSSMIVCTVRYAFYAFIQSILFILHTFQNVVDISSLHVYNCTVLGIHFWSILMGDLSWLVWKRLACMKRSCIFLSLWSGRSVFCSCMISWLWYFMWDTYMFVCLCIQYIRVHGYSVNVNIHESFISMYTSVAWTLGPSVTTSSTDFSFQNLVFWSLVWVFSSRNQLKINVSRILEPYKFH